MSEREPDGTGPLEPQPREGRWHYRRSLASRVVLLTTIAVGLSVAFVALGGYVTTRMQLQSSLDESLLDRASAAADEGTLLQIADDDSSMLTTAALGAADVRIAFLRADGYGRTLDTGPTLSLGQAELDVARGDAESSVRTIRAGGEKYRVVAVPTNNEDIALVIAQSLDEQDRTLSRLGFVSMLFGGLGVLGAAVAGWWVARNGLRPVRRLTSSVEGIARTEDLTALPVEGDDEIARLAAAFNRMLTALDASRERQRQLVADAGHELRTPLTSLRTNIDLLTQVDAAPQAHTLAPEARSELLADVRAQIEELTTLIGDLVELARDEPSVRVVEPMDVTEVLERAVARVRRRAPGVTLDVDTEPWWVVGEDAALERAMTNLLDNAAKWSPPGGRVEVRLKDGVLTVDDEGPGIAAEDRHQVFDRFWRAEESRTMPGSGLGLSIVRQVAERHSGTVEVSGCPSGGARLVLRLPGSTEPGKVGRARRA